MSKLPHFEDRLKAITKRNSRVKKHKPGTTWPLESRIEAVTQFLVLGNMKQVSVLTGISYDLLREWKTKAWWRELEAEIRQAQNIELSTKLSKIVDRSLDAVLDRVENGDFVFDQKAGQIVRKPAALRDVHRVAVDSITKRELLRGEEQVEQARLSVEDHLKMIAGELAKWNGSKPVIELNDEDVTDVTPKDEDEDADYELVEDSGESGEDAGVPEEVDSEESGICESLPSGESEQAERVFQSSLPEEPNSKN